MPGSLLLPSNVFSLQRLQPQFFPVQFAGVSISTASITSNQKQ
jgi:hypothetical protein